MKFNPRDPLLEALVADEEALSARAASAIRSRRRRNRRLGAAATAAFAAVVAMLVFYPDKTRLGEGSLRFKSVHLQKKKLCRLREVPLGKDSLRLIRKTQHWKKC